jgi:hypothetical protein
VAGAVNPDTVNSEPATEIPEIVTGAVPVAVRTTPFVPYCPTATLPKSTLAALMPRVETPAEPVPLRLITALGLLEELLEIVTAPVNELA